ncbi:hypothetical protein GCM10028798_23210 [Humibacter antri]
MGYESGVNSRLRRERASATYSAYSPEGRYDDLGERSQAIVRAIWDEQLDERRARLDLAAEFTRTGRPWTEGDENGRAVVRGVDAGA